MEDTEPQDGLVDLLLGALSGLDAYHRVARRGFGAAWLTTALAVVLLAIPVSVRQHLQLGEQIDAVRESSVWLMPRVHLEAGVASMNAEAPRVMEAERFVVVLDPRDEPELPAAAPGDRRPRYVLLRHALVVFTADRATGNVLPWGQLNQVLGDISFDGPELVDGLESARPGMVGVVTGLRIAAALLWTLFAAVIGAAVYRTVFYVRRDLPSGSALRAIGALAGVPAALAATGAVLIGAADGVVVGAFLAVGGVVFLAAASSMDRA